MLGRTISVTGAALLLAVLLVGPSSQAQAQVDTPCTLTQGFWKNHAEAWPVDSITLGTQAYTKDQALAVLATPPKGGDARYILAHQLIAAKLNAAQLPATVPSDVTAAIDEADAWLTTYPLSGTTKPAGADREAMIALADLLDQFNNGLIGWPHCGDEPPPPPPGEES